MLRDRFNPRIPAKEYATQSIPGARVVARAFRSDPSNAKLQMTTTRMPNKSLELNASFLLDSMAISLKTIAAIGLIALLPMRYTAHRLLALQDRSLCCR